MNPQALLVCQSQQFQRAVPTILKCSCGNQAVMMSYLVAIAAQLAGVSVDCPTLSALSAQYACLPPQSQLPALIYLFAQILANGNVNPQVFSGLGPPVAIGLSPVASSAIYFDITIPATPNMWQWSNTTWTEIIGD